MSRRTETYEREKGKLYERRRGEGGEIYEKEEGRRSL